MDPEFRFKLLGLAVEFVNRSSGGSPDDVVKAAAAFEDFCQNGKPEDKA